MSEASPALGAPDTWVAPLARALPALVLGLVITFSQDHSARLGLTGDVLLVCHKDQASKVRNVVELLKKSNKKDYL